ncbi:unnamed protein product [Prorocentrum cordatum]|uniref:Protein xylosyltransferase n=1 Tax=Prorocentrum cordatum TaxID=2364126 RepID=A0ABN9U2K5_9DINO|nr:unnamed protein product [Polarella glacialis]
MKVCLLLFLFWIGCIAVAVVTDPWALIHGFRVLHAASAAQSSEQHSSQPAPSQSLLEQTMTPRSSSQPALQKPIHAQTTTQQASGQSYTSQQFTEANKSGNVVGGPVKLHEAAQQIVKSGWQLLNLSAQAAQLVLNAVPIDLARQPEPRARVYSLGSSEGRLQLPPVEYSLIVNMHNRYKNLVTVLASYLITPRGSFELLAFCDGCNAKTLQRAEKAFDTYLPIVWNGSAAACSLEFLKSVTGHVAPGKSNQRYWEPVREMCVAACGDAFFRQCGSLRRAVLVDQPSAIYETASNNRGAILAEGQFLIIMQDDWVMTQIGWNVHMSLPARLYDDLYFLMDADDHAFHTSAVHSQGWVSGYPPCAPADDSPRGRGAQGFGRGRLQGQRVQDKGGGAGVQAVEEGSAGDGEVPAAREGLAWDAHRLRERADAQSYRALF